MLACIKVFGGPRLTHVWPQDSDALSIPSMRFTKLNHHLALLAIISLLQSQNIPIGFCLIGYSTTYHRSITIITSAIEIHLICTIQCRLRLCGSGGKSSRLVVWGLPVWSHPGCVEVSLNQTSNPQLLLTSWLVPCMSANCRWWVNVWMRGINCTALWIKALYKCSPFTIEIIDNVFLISSCSDRMI